MNAAHTYIHIYIYNIYIYTSTRLNGTALERILGFSLEHCLMKVWPNTDLFCGGSHGIPLDERLRVKRPYGRVDRVVRLCVW
jgi:hypothetical protein